LPETNLIYYYLNIPDRCSNYLPAALVPGIKPCCLCACFSGNRIILPSGAGNEKQRQKLAGVPAASIITKKQKLLIAYFY
jgi:hypothetical protein